MVKEPEISFLFSLLGYDFLIADIKHSKSTASDFQGDVSSPFHFPTCLFLGTRKCYKFVHVTETGFFFR